jgi:hypothetical protein
MRRILLALCLIAAALTALPSTPASAASPKCKKAPQIKDTKGDATDFVVLIGALPNEPQLDVLSGTILYDAKKKALTFKIGLAAVSSSPPLLAQGEVFRFYFEYLTVQYHVRVTTYDLTGDPTLYELYRTGAGPTGGNEFLGDLKGSVSTGAKTISVPVSLATFNKLAKPSKKLAVGGKFETLQILGQRNAELLTLSADTADGSCAFVLEAPKKKKK